MNKVLKEIGSYVLIILFVILIRTFIITPVRVDGLSMSPTLDDGEILLLNKLDKKYKRFDIVVIDYNGTKIIKRVIGLPSESVMYKENSLYINGEKVEESFISTDVKTEDFVLTEFNHIPDNYYFVVGDNRNNSVDSRIIGLINKKDILGKVKIALFPFNDFGFIK